MKSDQEQKEQSMEQPMSKEKARAKQAEADREAMPEQAKMARVNADGRVVVHFGQGQKAVVHVTHRGEPHPKGFSAVIVSHSGDRFDGKTRQQILDAAMDYAKGKATSLVVDEYQEELKADGKPVDPAGAGTPGSPLGGQGAGAPPSAPPAENIGSDAKDQTSATSPEVTPAAPGN